MPNAISSRVACRPADDKERQRALCSLVESVYPEMCAVAAKYLRNESPSEALQPAGLVHEAFLRLMRSAAVHPCDSFHTKALLCRQMRRILIEHARQRIAEHQQLRLQCPLAKSYESYDVTLAVTLERLATVHKRAAQVVELRVWGGLSTEQIARTLDVSRSTVLRDWNFGRAWLSDHVLV